MAAPNTKALTKEEVKAQLEVIRKRLSSQVEIIMPEDDTPAVTVVPESGVQVAAPRWILMTENAGPLTVDSYDAVRMAAMLSRFLGVRVRVSDDATSVSGGRGFEFRTEAELNMHSQAARGYIAGYTQGVKDS